jgi:DNA-binding transcriptional ArsR family regulator
MTATDTDLRPPTASDGDCREPGDDSLEAAIDLLSDEYACRILGALDERPMPAAALADACGMSRPTVYRRLDRLEAVGLVTAQLTYDPDGHHRKRFHLALDELEVRIGADGVSGRLAVADPVPD